MRRFVLPALLLVLCCPAAPARAGDWLQRTLQFQADLGDTVPLVNAPWLGTHNSFNTRSELPTVSGLDANQMLSMGAQLELGIRSLELDIHSIPSPFQPLTRSAPVVCHAESQEQLNAGCSTERLLGTRLEEIRDWLDAHSHEVILLYLEDHFDGVEGSDEAAAALESVLGDKLYKPSTGCAPMPLSLTRKEIRRAGKQVLAISGCGEGTGWGSLVFDDAAREASEQQPTGYQPYPNCDPDDARDETFYAEHFVRVFEDSTVVSTATSPGKPPTRIDAYRMSSLVDCGVDLISLDQVVEEDPRLKAAVWTFAPGEPSAPGCVVMRIKDGRWEHASCAGEGRFACRTRWGNLTVGGLEGYGRSRRGCAGASFGLPRTPAEASQLRAAMKLARVDRVWLRLKTR